MRGVRVAVDITSGLIVTLPESVVAPPLPAGAPPLLAGAPPLSVGAAPVRAPPLPFPADPELEQLAPASAQAPRTTTAITNLRLFANIPDLCFPNLARVPDHSQSKRGFPKRKLRGIE